MSGLRFLPRRRAPRHLSGAALTEAIAKLPAEHPVHRPVPVPSFAGGRPGMVMPDGSPVPIVGSAPARGKPYLTAPLAVVREVVDALPVEEPLFPTFTPAAAPAAPGPYPARPPEWHAPETAGDYRRLLHGLEAIPVPPRPPAPDWRVRAAAFTADVRRPRSGGLPLFRATAREIGRREGLPVNWCGLDEIRPIGRHVRWSTAGWARQTAERIATAAEAARAEIAHVADELARQEKRIRAAADVAPDLGHPGGDL